MSNKVLCANCDGYYSKPIDNKQDAIFCPYCKHTDIIENPGDPDCKICIGMQDCDMTTICGKCLGCGRKVKY